MNSTAKDLSIITITMNNDMELISTLDSIENQGMKPSEVIIKDCIVRNFPKFLEKYSFHIKYISRKDEGIYDAMNQALNYTNKSYILFLNSGDYFYDNFSIISFTEDIKEYNEKNSKPLDILFYSWTYQTNNIRKKASIKPLRFNHQAVIYKRNLHNKFGNYINSREFTAADYLFIRLTTLSSKTSYIISKKILSTVDPNGRSATLKTPLMVASVDYILGINKRSWLVIIAIFHPIYYYCKSLIKIIFNGRF